MSVVVIPCCGYCFYMIVGLLKRMTVKKFRVYF
jgi:hypothetical protein